MDYYFKEFTQNGKKYYEITDFKKEAVCVEILPEINGLPLENISQRALTKASHIKKFILPSLNEDYSLARFILNNTIQALRISFITNDGELELAFPKFVSHSVEDTMARAIHTKIEGSGYAFRECVMKNKIDAESYDRLFARAKADGQEICTDIALSRLMHPMDLGPVFKEEYETFLKENATFASNYLITENDRARLSFLFNSFSFSDKIYEDALRLCVEKRRPALTSLIMNSKGK